VDKCKNHPVRFASGRCKRCHLPLCNECKLTVAEGVFCSEQCAEQFRSFQSRLSTFGGYSGGFSLMAWIKHLAAAAVLVIVIYAALYFWLGTSDPSEMWHQLLRQFRILR
jgi:hypothetical protein